MSDDEAVVSTQILKNSVNEMVKCILSLDHSKKPFKQTEISQYLSEKPNRSTWKRLLAESQNCLKKMGMKLVENKNSSAKSFFLVGCNNPLPFMHRYASKSEQADRTLLVIILAYIFMKEGTEGTVSQDDLHNHLERLNIPPDATNHEYFGNVKKKVLTDFADQLYLNIKKNKDTDVMEVSWGQRAECEVTKRSILEFVCQHGFNNKIKPENLVSHYQKVQAEELQNQSEVIEEQQQ